MASVSKSLFDSLCPRRETGGGRKTEYEADAASK